LFYRAKLVRAAKGLPAPSSAQALPQNIGHILPRPLIAVNSVRISHLIETASSTFIFGLIVTWLLYPKRIR